MDVSKAIKKNAMNSCYVNMCDGVLRGPKLQQVNAWGTSWQNVNETFSYHLYCVCAEGRMICVDKLDAYMSDVDSFCVIETCETKKLRTDICIETYYELSDEEMQCLNEIDWREFYDFIGLNTSPLTASKRAYVETWIHMQDGQPAKRIVEHNGERQDYTSNISLPIDICDNIILPINICDNIIVPINIYNSPESHGESANAIPKVQQIFISHVDGFRDLLRNYLIQLIRHLAYTLTKNL